MAPESAEGVWALMLIGGRYFVGEIICQKEEQPMPGAVLESRRAIGEEVMVIPIRSASGAPAFRKEVTAEPLIFSWEGSPLHVKPDMVSQLRSMKPGDQERYKKIIADGERLIGELRAQAAGLVTP